MSKQPDAIDFAQALESLPLQLAMDLDIAAELRRQHEAIKALEADAERYRWLRSQESDDFCFAVVKNPHFDVYQSAEELDAAIDAARKELE